MAGVHSTNIQTYRHTHTRARARALTLPLPPTTFCSVNSSHVAKKYLRTFDRVRPGVERMTKRSFTHDDLGRIVFIWKEAYSLEQVGVVAGQRTRRW